MTGRVQTPFPVAWAASKAVLAVASPLLTTGEAKALMLQHYAIAGTATRLRGERDDNFRIDRNDGSRLILKVSHQHEEPVVTNLHTSLLLHLAATTPMLATPRVLFTTDGLSEVQLTHGKHAGRTARVTSYLYGRPLESVPTSASLRREVGATLARLGAASVTSRTAQRIESLCGISSGHITSRNSCPSSLIGTPGKRCSVTSTSSPMSYRRSYPSCARR